MFTYTVQDVLGKVSNVAGVLLTDAQVPVVTNPGDRTYQIGEQVSLQIQASDPNNGDILTYSQQGLPGSLVINKNNGLISGTVTASVGEHLVTVRATDGSGLYHEQSFMVSIEEELKTIEYQEQVTQAGCLGNDGSIELEFAGGIELSMLTISWSNGANTAVIEGLIPGTYTVTISGTGYKTVARSYVINVDQQVVKPQITKTGNTLQSTKSESYQWYRDKQLIEGANFQTLDLPGSGNYSVTTLNEKGCSASSDPIYVKKEFEQVAVYPNPTIGELHIENSYQHQQALEYILMDQFGRAIWNGSELVGPGESKITIDLSERRITAGVYILKLKSSDQAGGIGIFRITFLN
jgi:hypothetical protein